MEIKSDLCTIIYNFFSLSICYFFPFFIILVAIFISFYDSCCNIVYLQWYSVRHEYFSFL